MPRQFCRAPKHFAIEHHECYAHDGPSAPETSPLFARLSPSFLRPVGIVSFLRSCKTIAKLQLYVGKTDEAKNAREAVGAGQCFKLCLRMEAAYVFLAGAYYDPSSRSSALYANSAKSRRAFGRRSAQDRGWLCGCRIAMSAGPSEHRYRCRKARMRSGSCACQGGREMAASHRVNAVRRCGTHS
jgi:hypothetical protein